MSFPAIEVHNLSKNYGQVKAVDNISFKVEKGSLFGFLGPNGAGKSTTQRILTGVIQPDKGDVNLMGHSIRQEPIKAKGLIGVVPEQANIYPDLTALENLVLTGEIYGQNKNTCTTRVSTLLRKFNLYEKKNLKAKGFSKGMKQRLLLCMALINDPEILFLDEPTTGLDVESKKVIRDIITEYSNQNKTIFLTTHDIEEASYLCDKVAIINQGKIAVIDTPTRLKESISELKTIEIIINSHRIFIFLSLIFTMYQTRRKEKPTCAIFILLTYANY
ncbi:ABC transporter ATP-binding protein [Natranaerofaba carboxydovora]|uniref:ABC transporter ATP-binding protein n=1 Tax=Natranaerofaba carboxydovora TaxID=2742683 RepID=UPI001F135319|nr:ABC transporter ATP-binding protein [Natranaerofaba carboxydovora]UMZ75469.1 Daunorubicin/doxorubicin resistance ATP-binding protein DrrA [Natranaerofaba carboxydovora]